MCLFTVRLQLCQGYLSGTWLNAYSTQDLDLKFTTYQVRVLLEHRLGLPICQQSLSICGMLVGLDGFHGFAEKKKVGRHPPHAMIKDLLKRVLTTYNYASQSEPMGITSTDEKSA